MGKIRIKTLGDETLEHADKEKAQEKREQKVARLAQDSGKKSAHISGMSRVAGSRFAGKGGERTTTVGVSEEDILAELENKKSGEAEEKEGKASVEKSASGGKIKSNKKKKIISERHKENKTLTSKNPVILSQAIQTLRKFKKGSFDETVELHINTTEKGISQTVMLPHGTGKTLRIKIADDALVSQIESGKIDFDILVAAPAMMPKLAKVAKILGPKGLMPNPKNGTITDNTSEAVEKLSKGQIGLKTEAGAPIIHLTVGRLSFDDTKLSDNISTILSAIGPVRISSVFLKSTMSPAVKLSISPK